MPLGMGVSEKRFDLTPKQSEQYFQKFKNE